MLYDHHIAVDWSANATPKRGRDSIWISEDGRAAHNPRTRAEAMAWIADRIGVGDRLHIGFDFAFGLSRGAGQALLGAPGWDAYWTYLHDHIEDGPRNASNRFAVGGMLNARADAEGPFWGHPHQHSYAELNPTRCVKGRAAWPHPFPAHRHCDARQRGAQEIWKLAYTGSVGSQMLLGVAALERLRRACSEVAIWPFQTGFADDLSARVLVTEIYPSSPLWNYRDYLAGESCADAAQVRAVSDRCREADSQGRFADWLEPTDASEAERADAVAEEGWILGL